MGRRSDAAQHEQRHLLEDVNVNVELVGKKRIHEEDDCRCEEEEAYSVQHGILSFHLGVDVSAYTLNFLDDFDVVIHWQIFVLGRTTLAHGSYSAS